MNCRRFQNLLLEYLDGSLSPALRTRADAHLAHCEDCRQLRQQRESFAQTISERFHRETARLALSPEAERRVLAAISDPTASLTGRRWIFGWPRLVWPLGIAAAVLLAAGLGTGYHFGRQGPAKGALEHGGRDLATPVSIHFSDLVPRHTLIWKGNSLTDSVTFETCVVDQTF